MSKSRQARVPRFESMEDRVVLSGATVPVLVQDARLVQQDFASFRATYSSDFQTVLYGTSTTGSINPSGNRATFDADVATALGTLNTSIDTAISGLPDASTLESTIQSELLGTGGNALQAQLAAISTPTGAYTLSSHLFAADSATDIRLTSLEINHQIRTSTPPTTTTTSSGSSSSGSSSTGGTSSGGSTTTGTLSSSQLAQDLGGVRSSFATFKTAYSNDVKSILYAEASDGSINPTTARPAFDAQVATDLSTLSASVSSALTTIPSNSSLLTEVQGEIVGSGSNTLQTALADLTTPAGVQTTSQRAFEIDSAMAIASVEVKVLANVVQTAGPEVSNS